jgi:hypothetical protein
MSEVSNTETIEKPAYLEDVLKFLHQTWWRIDACGFDCLPDKGPAVIAGNTSGYIPWPALMLIYTVSHHKSKSRPIYTLVDSDILADEQLNTYLRPLNFVPWSYDNAKQLLEKGELIAIFPEDNSVLGKTIALRNRIQRFDWTKFLPAVEMHAPIYPLATLGIDEANMVLHNSDFLANLFKTKAFPITPFFPWLPFPFNLSTMPVPWKMKLMSALSYSPVNDREATQSQAKKVALRTEGDIQAEINRLLRARN